MKLGNLNETVILIDTDYLNEKISENLTFYQDLYPMKQFNHINLDELILRFAERSKINVPGQIVDVIFAYSLPRFSISFCNPSDLMFEIDNRKQLSALGEFQLKSFFAEENESTIQHFINILRQLYFNINVKRIIMVADHSELNDEIETNEYHEHKNLFLIKNYNDTHISIPVNYVDIDYLVACSLGLNRSEI